MEDRLGLTTVTLLLTDVTTLTLGKLGRLTRLVLGHLVRTVECELLSFRRFVYIRVLPAPLTLAVCPAGLWNVHHLI